VHLLAMFSYIQERPTTLYANLSLSIFFPNALFFELVYSFLFVFFSTMVVFGVCKGLALGKSFLWLPL
jgi:hypothetical protein